jgi:hypothetical protein
MTKTVLLQLNMKGETIKIINKQKEKRRLSNNRTCFVLIVDSEYSWETRERKSDFIGQLKNIIRIQ